MKNPLAVITLSLLVLIFMNLFSMPLVTKNLNSPFFGQLDKRILDLRHQGYQKHDVLLFFELIGPQGRQDYQKIQIPIDIIYPLLFTLGYSLFFAAYFRLRNRSLSVKKYQLAVISLPFISAILDWSENVNTYFLLQNFPSIDAQKVSLGSHLTQYKFLFITITLFIFTMMISHLIFNKVRERLHF